jgi:hypothetical protein
MARLELSELNYWSRRHMPCCRETQQRGARGQKKNGEAENASLERAKRPDRYSRAEAHKRDDYDSQAAPCGTNGTIRELITLAVVTHRSAHLIVALDTLC